MESIKSIGLEPKKEKRSKIFKVSFALILIVFAFTMSSPSSFFQIVKPAEAAGTLNGIAILPTNNIVNTRGTYDIIFNTATTGTIKFIHMTFPSGFDVSAATRWIERSGIGSGSLSAPNPTTLIYTVTSPVSVPAATTIRLEIPKIVNPNTAGSFNVGISTEDPTPVIIDGPTQSPSFPIKDITGNDISPSFMVRKTLNDDAVGNTKGWNPNGVIKIFLITDSDISGSRDAINVEIQVDANVCAVDNVNVNTHTFGANCNFAGLAAPPANAKLQYTITKLPSHLVTSSLSVSSSGSDSSPSSRYESTRSHDQIASEFP